MRKVLAILFGSALLALTGCRSSCCSQDQVDVDNNSSEAQGSLPIVVSPDGSLQQRGPYEHIVLPLVGFATGLPDTPRVTVTVSLDQIEVSGHLTAGLRDGRLESGVEREGLRAVLVEEIGDAVTRRGEQTQAEEVTVAIAAHRDVSVATINDVFTAVRQSGQNPILIGVDSTGSLRLINYAFLSETAPIEVGEEQDEVEVAEEVSSNEEERVISDEEIAPEISNDDQVGVEPESEQPQSEDEETTDETADEAVQPALYPGEVATRQELDDGSLRHRIVDATGRVRFVYEYDEELAMRQRFEELGLDPDEMMARYQPERIDTNREEVETPAIAVQPGDDFPRPVQVPETLLPTTAGSLDTDRDGPSVVTDLDEPSPGVMPIHVYVFRNGVWLRAGTPTNSIIGFRSTETAVPRDYPNFQASEPWSAASQLDYWVDWAELHAQILHLREVAEGRNEELQVAVGVSEDLPYQLLVRALEVTQLHVQVETSSEPEEFTQALHAPQSREPLFSSPPRIDVIAAEEHRVRDRSERIRLPE